MRIVSICFLLLAFPLLTFSAKQTAAELAAKAESSELNKQPDLYVKAAQLQLKTVDALYDRGNTEEGRNAVALLADYCEKAADAAVRSRKKMKKAEIEIRKIAGRLSDIQRSLSFDDQAPVKSAVSDLQDLRTKLLDHMFSKDKKK